MTRPLSEPSVYKDIGRGVWRTNQLERRPIPETDGLAIYEIKVFEDVNQVLVGDDKFVWQIPEDLDGAEVVKVEAFISTSGSGTTQVQIRHSGPCATGADILSPKITIDSGECDSKDAAVQPVVSSTIVDWGDHLHIDVDAAGTGAMGLGVIVVLAPAAIASVVLEGVQGPPGGVTTWQGGWATATGYVAGDVVTNNGTVYVSIQNHTSSGTSEPGVGGTWTMFWEPLFETQVYSGVDVIIHGGSYNLVSGIKGYVSIPFDCDIVEATLLANASGSCVVDLWKDTYGAFPPVNADSITGASPLTLSAANKTTDTSLSGWTTSMSAGDVLAVNIDSISGISFLTVALRLQKV